MTENVYTYDPEYLLWLVFGNDEDDTIFEDEDMLPDDDPFCMPALSVGDYDTAEYEKQFN